MGSASFPLGISGEQIDLGGSHTIKPASENDYNIVSAMKQSTDLEVFRFLDLPAEIRKKIYGSLLIHHEPVELTICKIDEAEGLQRTYGTRLGMFPQICRTSKAVADESFAVLYGDNLFHMTSTNEVALDDCYLGLRIYSHYIKTVMVDTFTLQMVELLETCMNRSVPSSLWQNAKLDLQSLGWARGGYIICHYENIKKLYLNLPQYLKVLTDNNKKTILDIKRTAPKDITVEFCGATPDIVSELMAAWPLHIPEDPQKIVAPVRKDLQPFKPLQWRNEQLRRQERDGFKRPLSPTASTRPIAQTTVMKRSLYCGSPGNESAASKKQKLDGGITCSGSIFLTESAKTIGRSPSIIEINARLIALKEKKGVLECALHALDKEEDAHKHALNALKKETKAHKSALITLTRERDTHACALGAVEEEKSYLESSLGAVEEEKGSLECELYGFSVVDKK